MNESDLKYELEKLKEEINSHNYRYHVLDDPLISDYEFDQKFKRLREIELNHPDWVTPDSPTQRAGSQIAEKFGKVRHPGPILSLANAFSKTEISAWFERVCKLDDRVGKTAFVVEPKIDGLTVVIHYENGIYKQGVTRGDGVVGEDITQNIKTIRAVPLKIPVENKDISVPKSLVVRGEAFIFKKEFERLNRQLEEEGERTYQNPRNTAAGSLRQLNPALTASRPLTLLTYAIVRSSNKEIRTQWETLQFLKQLGFPVTDLAVLCKDLEEVVHAIDRFTEIRDQIPYEVDGAVVKINDLNLAEELGTVGKDPRGAIAFKFEAREVTTKLLAIGINVGRTGVLTPTAALEPVQIGGVVVKQATLHNFDYIREKDIRIGDKVLVKRAGDVIPYVIGPIIALRSGQEKIFQIPSVCPVCLQPVEHYNDEVAWYCVNAACPAQLKRNIEHFVSRSAMDIVGMGEKIVEQLVDSGLVKGIPDIYSLTKDDLLKLEGFADKKAENLLAGIINSKNQPLNRVIYGLGIHGVGEVAAIELANQFKDLDELCKSDINDLQEMEGFGPNISQSIVDWFENSANKQTLHRLKAVGIWPSQKLELTNSPLTLKGLTFVITGTLTNFSREQAKEYIQSHGGKVTDSVGRSTDFLVAGNDAGSKLNKARELSIAILNEEELRIKAQGSK